MDFRGHTNIEGKTYRCYTLFLVPVRVQNGDICRVPAWVPNKVIQELGLENHLYDAQYMMGLFNKPHNLHSTKRARTTNLYRYLSKNSKTSSKSTTILSPGSKGVQTHTIYLPDSCLPSPLHITKPRNIVEDSLYDLQI